MTVSHDNPGSDKRIEPPVMGKLPFMGAVSYKIKDLLDRTAGWLAFIGLSPVFWLAAAFIRLDSPGPIFFRQVRIGEDGRPFVAYKFRTMVDKATTMGLGFNLEPNDSRITRVGNFLRDTSLDELPQLFNIIKGEMSLVGPRPTQAYQVLAYNTFQRRRLLVKPGITGWAQVNGRNTLTWEERFKLDVWYVDHWSLGLDFYILMRTLKVWAQREDLYAPDISYDIGNPEDEEKAIEIFSAQAHPSGSVRSGPSCTQHLDSPRCLRRTDCSGGSDRWEQGSDFHWLTYAAEPASPLPWGKNPLFFGCARHVLRRLLQHGSVSRGWKRLWIPSYFCQEVLSSILSGNIELSLYPDCPGDAGPQLDGIETRPGDVVLLVNFFGLRHKGSIDRSHLRNMEVIEDHSHDPWSDWARTSNADWCIASLRKTLPLPDGGVLWSAAGHELPAAVPATAAHQRAALEKFTAMVLKGLYLEGYPVEKDTYLRLLHSGEHQLGEGEVSGMLDWTRSLLSSFPVAKWRNLRRRNHQVLSAELSNLRGVEVLQPRNGLSTCPFSGILLFDSPQKRSRVREKLIAARVYPAILWPLEKTPVAGVSQKEQDFSQRMLSVHCDMRYDETEMKYVTSLIKKYGEGKST